MTMSQSKFEYVRGSLSFFNPSINPKDKLAENFNKVITQNYERDSPPGIFFNENHRHKFPKQFLTTNVEYLKSMGIKTLFLEFYLYDEHQKLLEEYNNSPPNTLLPDALRKNLEEGQAAAYGHIGDDSSIYTDLIIAAHKSGIRLVALDSLQAHPCHSFGGWLDARKELFNAYAAKIIKQEHRGNPYIVYTGLIHGYKGGIPKILNTPNLYSVFLTDSSSNDYPVDMQVCASDYLDRKYGIGLEERCWDMEMTCL